MARRLHDARRTPTSSSTPPRSGSIPDVDARLDLDLDYAAHRAWSSPTSFPIRRARAWSRDAEARGCTVLDGLGMLVNQGVIGIKYWTGVDVDPGVMRRKIQELFGL